jgi:hypothetical protein
MCVRLAAHTILRMGDRVVRRKGDAEGVRDRAAYHYGLHVIARDFFVTDANRSHAGTNSRWSLEAAQRREAIRPASGTWPSSIFEVLG